MSIVKVNTGLFFVLTLAISGGVFAKKLLTPHPKFHPLLSKSLKQYPGLKFHPHSEHYIYNLDTVENTDKTEFKALASKLSKLPSNFPSKIILATVPAPLVVSDPSVASSTDLNTGNPLTNRELYLISKYWLQLLPHFNSELLKCLTGPTAKSEAEAGGDEFPSNCPSEIRYLNQNSEKSSSSTIKITNPSFNIPDTLYSKLQKCSNSKCQGSKPENCYCESASACTEPCKAQKTLSVGPRFFTPGSISSHFSYPSQPQSPQKLLQTFNATNPPSNSNQLKLPHFSFPLPHSSHTTSNTKNSGSESLTTPIHWPQKIVFKTNFKVELNGTESNNSETSLNVLVQKLLDSPASYSTYGPKLQADSPTQLFFVRYLATLYALLWSYSPHSLPLFPSDSQHSLLSEHDIPSPTKNTSPLFNIHTLSTNPITSKK